MWSSTVRCAIVPTKTPTIHATSITTRARQMIVKVLLPAATPMSAAAAKLVSANEVAMTREGMVQHSVARSLGGPADSVRAF
jgi:hypothetical protein